MKRRDFLGTSCLVLLAGCTGENTDDTNTDPDDTVEEPSNSTVSENNDTSDEGMDNDQPDTGQPVDVAITQQEWAVEGERAEFLVANQSDSTASVEVVVQWFDGEGNYLDEDRSRAPALKGGASWFTGIERTVMIEAAEFEVSVSGVEIPTELPDGIEITSTQLDTEVPMIEGLIENQQSTATNLELLATGYNGDWLTYTGSTRVSNIPPETNWRYELFLENIAADNDELDDIQLYIW